MGGWGVGGGRGAHTHAHTRVHAGTAGGALAASQRPGPAFLPPLTSSRPAPPCRRYEQESYEGLVKTIEGQDLLPQVGQSTGSPSLGAAILW